ncbi:ABC transporter substrate-binding protein [Skermanella mucosa]
MSSDSTNPPKPATHGITRRQALKGTAAAAGLAVGSGAITGFPTIWAQNIKNVTLRQFGTGVSNLNAVAEKVKQDLGFTLQMTALDSDAVSQRAVTQPKSYDIADIEYWICKKVFPAGVMQPMDVGKIKNFDKIVPLFITGKLTPESSIAQGTAPHTVGFVEGKDSTSFAKSQTQWMTLIPTIYNADTLGIRPDLVGKPITQWKDLLDPAFKGKASILNIPSIGIMDAAMVAESMGEMKYGDKGNMTKAEIDKTIALLIEAKKAGQFRAFWKTFDESVNLMASGEVVIQSMWSPAVAAVRAKGIPCTYQPLKEGYRARGRRPGHRQACQRAGAGSGLRVHQLVPVRLGRRLPEPPGLLQRRARHREGAYERRGMGLLDGRQAGRDRHPQPGGQSDGEGRRGPRRRLLL